MHLRNGKLKKFWGTVCLILGLQVLDEGKNSEYDAIFLQVQEFNRYELGVKLGRVCTFH